MSALSEMPISNSGKFHIGILLPQVIDGGYFQLFLSIADSLLKYSVKYRYSLLVYEMNMLDWLENLNPHVGIVHVHKNKFHHRVNTFVNVLLGYHVLPSSRKGQAFKLKEAEIDLMIIPFPSLFGFMENIPYVVAIADIMYKYYPKYYSLRSRLQAMIVHRYAAKYSAISIVDSAQGMDDLNKFFNIPKEKIRIVPLMPPGYIYSNRHMDTETAEGILAKFELPERYLFYPSQLCHDKNHVRLIRSLKLIEQRYGIRVPLVLAGGSDESYREIMHVINESDMNGQVIYLGFVSGEEVVALYKNADALAFASICGPTSIPPVEAMILGTPVVCSNLFSMPDQVGDAGLLFDPFKVEDMAEKICMIWRDENLRKKLVQKGYEKIKDLTQENYARLWERSIEDAINTIW